MTYRISKEFGFSASHVLIGLPDGHPCGRLHGHNYKVRVTIEAEDLDETGFVVDYRALAPFKQWIDDNLDHRHLNDMLVQPTAEQLSKYLRRMLYSRTSVWEVLPPNANVTVAISETDKTWAEWQPCI